MQQGPAFPEGARRSGPGSPKQRRRADGSFEDISWDYAIGEIGATIARLIEEYGPDAVSAYLRNPKTFNAPGSATGMSFTAALDSDRTFSAPRRTAPTSTRSPSWCTANPLAIEPAIGETLQLRPDTDAHLLAAMVKEIGRTTGSELGALEGRVRGLDVLAESISPYPGGSCRPGQHSRRERAESSFESSPWDDHRWSRRP